jgi:23S rRNA (cytosine1962-C5)-methyltransferase
MNETWLIPELLWPALPSRWLLADTPDWLAVDKPVDVACPPGVERLDARGPALRNDVAGRLHLHWRELGLADPTQPLTTLFDPLDGQMQAVASGGQAVSGVCVVAKRPEVAEALQQQELQGRVRLTVVLGVYRWPGELPPERERREAVARLLAGLQVKVKSVRTLRNRSLVTLQYASGRCLDLVRELHKSAVVVAGPRDEGVNHGDPLAPATSRLLVHRQRVEMPPGTLESPVPAAFARWLAHEQTEPFDDRLDAALVRRFVLGRGQGTTAFRLLDSVVDDVAIDRYGPDLVFNSLVDLRMDAGPQAVQDAVQASMGVARHVGDKLGARAVYLKLRPRQANTVVDAVAAGLAPVMPVYGTAPAVGEVLENGLRFHVRLGGGLGTGIYLDQRDNRRWVLDHAAGLRVLNTFAYTCAFTVAAAAGGAVRTVSIDASQGSLEEGRANLELNGFHDATQHDLIRGDVFHWLPRLSRRGDRFDLIILDPPSYSRVKTRRFSAATDYGELVATALQLLAPGGTLLASTNHAGIDRKRFHQMVLDGAHLAGRRVLHAQHRPGSVDHPGGRMKAMLLRVE